MGGGEGKKLVTCDHGLWPVQKAAEGNTSCYLNNTRCEMSWK